MTTAPLANFNGQTPMIDVRDTAMLLIDHQSGLFQGSSRTSTCPNSGQTSLATALATFGKAVRAGIDQASEIGDQDAADVFTEVSRGIDKSLWFVEAHGQASR